MKEKEMKRVPKLRFPEFTDDWEQRKCKAVAPLQRGFDLPISQMVEGEYPVVMSNGIGGYHNEYKVKGPGVITGRSGTIGKIQYIESDYWPHNTALWVTDFKNNYPQFIFYLYMNLDLSRFGTGSGVPTLNRNDVHDALVYVPNLDEQKKLAAYFNSIDHLITLHQRKLEKLKELRKGVMKKLFNQEVRFKADDESEFPEWEKKKIGDVFSQIKDKNKDGRNQNVITNSAEFGLINQRDFFDKDIAVDGKTENYTVIKTGDFVYNPRKSKQAPYGPFNCYQLEENGIVSPLYTCLRPKSNVNDKYLLWYFKSGSWYRFIYENGAQNGARHDRVGMTDSLMQEIPVYLPQAVEEQQKIADCLSTLDDVIEKQKETLAAWEELKKGLLQQMFV